MNESRIGSINRSLTLVDAIRQHAESRPQAVAYSLISSAGGIEASLTYRELLDRSSAIAASLSKVCRPGDRAILLFHGGPDFVVSFLGCMIAGVIAVPGYPVREPGPSAKTPRNFDRLVSIIKDAAPAVALTNLSVAERRAELAAVSEAFAGLEWIAVEQVEATDTPPLFAATPDDIAFLQYTSGSTSTPKGVMVSHGNLLAVFEDIDASCRFDETSVVVSWIPVYHDMGLIYGTLLPLCFGLPLYSLLPAAVLQQPVRWLQAMSRFRATHSAAPNFAYELCVQRVSEAAKAELDLSHLQVCVNGAETVRPQTLQRFEEAFASCGLKPDTIRAAYGLAESTLKVTNAVSGEPARSVWVDAEALERRRIVPLTGDAERTERTETARHFQGCGWTHIDADIRIVDPSTNVACDADATGEIWVRSPTVAQGYWNQPEATATTMQARLANGDGPFLRTGDIGFILDRELYVAGRIKDLIIIRGRNLYPQDIESTAEAAHSAVRLGRCGAFSVDADDGEGLVLVAEVERTERHGFDADTVLRAIREAVSRDHEVSLHDVVFVRTGTFPLTSSGKVQRQSARSEYLANSLDVVARMQPAPAVVKAPAEAAFHARMVALQEWLKNFVAKRMRIPAAHVSGEESFTALGLDSLALLEMTGDLEERLARVLPATIVLEHPDINRLSHHLAEQTS